MARTRRMEARTAREEEERRKRDEAREQRRKEREERDGRDEAHLHVAFCDIERGDPRVGDAAREDAAEHALGVVARVVRDGPEVPVAVAVAVSTASHLAHPETLEPRRTVHPTSRSATSRPSRVAESTLV